MSNGNETSGGQHDVVKQASTTSSPLNLDYGSTFLQRAAVALNAPDLAAAPDLNGYRFIDEKPLGEGGMAVVWKAEQISTKRLVALKIMRAASLGSARGQARFAREVELTAKLDHPNIARVYDSGLQKGMFFFAMELIDGQPLNQYVLGHQLPRPGVLELMKLICRAMQYAHQKGIIHRDLKFSNILISGDGQPHVLDFGLAKAVESDEQLSIDGDVSGTPAFMSPEQAAGRLDLLDTRSDVYTLGVIVYYLVCGRFPHDTSGSNLQVMKRICEEEPAPLRKVDKTADRELEALLAKALAREPGDRYGSAGELADDLDRYLKNEPLMARPPTLLYVLGKKLEKHRAPLTIAAAASIFLAAGILVATAIIVREQKAAHTAGMIERLIDADISHVPAIVDEMGEYRRWADPLLRQRNARAGVDSRQKLHTSLALLPVDAGQVDYLYQRLLAAGPDEIRVIRDALFPHKAALIERLWSVVQSSGREKEASRLRAAAALASFDPQGQKWATCSMAVASDLVRESPVFLGRWSELFRPVKAHLIAALTSIFRDPSPQHSTERNLATSLLGDYAADQPQVLADLMMDADESQFAALYPALKVQGQRAATVLTRELEQSPPADAKPAIRDRLARRRANAGIALLKMNQPAGVWLLFRHSADPSSRSYLIHRLAPLGVDPRIVVDRLQQESDVSARRALVLCLGEFGEQDFSREHREALIPKLQELYRTDTDPGLHSAVEWLLRTWKQQPWIEQTNAQWAKDDDRRAETLAAISAPAPAGAVERPVRWYVNSQGQTMVAIPGPVEFLMGSPITESNRVKDERQHRRRIGRTFALAAKPVTGEQYRRFSKNVNSLDIYRRAPDLPIVYMSWHQAAIYCNWLSEQEGMAQDQWCYEVENGRVKKMKENFLSLMGYRLPTEAEMEYATRAGAITSRYYGDSEELLSDYAWYLFNSGQQLWPTGTKKPNDLGFFDVHGNVWCWCQDLYWAYPIPANGSAVEDKEGKLEIADDKERVLRGGALNAAPYVRSAYRTDYIPMMKNSNFSFRPARTLRGE